MDSEVMKIKACPHCGGSACLYQNYSYKARTYFAFVECDICGARGKIYNSEEEPEAAGWDNAACRDAISAWNMRQGQQMQKNRTDYKICPFCGASLDVGEVCDCLQEKQPPQKRPRTHKAGQDNIKTLRKYKAGLERRRRT